MDFLLDTNFLIGLWRQPNAGAEVDFLEANPDAVLGLPWIAKGEFLAGAFMASHDRDCVVKFLSPYPVVFPGDGTLVAYAELYAATRTQRRHVAINDLWIAAAALERGVPLLTRNVKDFPREGVRVIDYAHG